MKEGYWANGIPGSVPEYVDYTDSPPGFEIFQFSNVAYWLLLHYYHIEQSSAVASALDTMATKLRLVTTASPGVLRNGITNYNLPYGIYKAQGTTPPRGTATDTVILSQMHSMTFAWHYARTGSTDFLNVIDAWATRQHCTYAGDVQSTPKQKEFGESYWM